MGSQTGADGDGQEQNKVISDEGEDPLTNLVPPPKDGDWAADKEEQLLATSRKAKRKEKQEPKRKEKRKKDAKKKEKGKAPTTAEGETAPRPEDVAEDDGDGPEPEPETAPAPTSAPASASGTRPATPFDQLDMGTFTPAKQGGDKRGREDPFSPRRQPQKKKSRGAGGAAKVTKALSQSTATSGSSAKPASETGSQHNVVIHRTRAEMRGVTGPVQAHVNLCLYVPIPKEAREPAIELDEFAEALRKGVALDGVNGAITEATALDAKGWRLKCSSLEAKKAAIGQKFAFRKVHLQIQNYATGSPVVFHADRSFDISAMELASVIAADERVQKKKASFWLGYREAFGIRGSSRILIFDKPPGLSGLDYHPDSLRTPGAAPKRIAFRPAKLDGECPVCRAPSFPHDVRECGQLMPFIPDQSNFNNGVTWLKNIPAAPQRQEYNE